jgi:hypothetical protein
MFRAKSISSRPESTSSTPNLSCCPTNQFSRTQINSQFTKIVPKYSLKNPRRQARRRRRRRPLRDGREVQEDYCTGASEVPMADGSAHPAARGSARPAARGSARPSANRSVRPAAGHPFHVWNWLMATATTTTVHGGHLPTVLARCDAPICRFVGSSKYLLPSRASTRNF